MENNNSLEKIESISLIIIVMINKIILNIPYYIVNLTETGSIINVAYIGIIDFIFLLVILKLFKNFENLDIIDLSEYLGGKPLKLIISIISILFFLLVGFTALLDFSNVLHTIYFSQFQIIYILGFFIFGIAIANFSGLKSISRVTSFIVPFAIISILVTFIAVFKDLSIASFTPVFGESYKNTFLKGLSNTFSMSIIIYYYFLKPLLKNPREFKKISIISYIISFLLLLLTVISMLTIFTSHSTNAPINSLFLLARQIELGTFLQRVDALFILLWILSIFCYLSFIIFLVNKIIKKISNISDEKMLTFSTCSILFGLTLIPFNIAQLNFIEDIICRSVILIFMLVIGIGLLILSNIKWLRKKGC